MKKNFILLVIVGVTLVSFIIGGFVYLNYFSKKGVNVLKEEYKIEENEDISLSKNQSIEESFQNQNISQETQSITPES